MKKIVRVRVRVGAHNVQTSIILEMLRYCELLCSNVEGFPSNIEYDANAASAKSQIDRWLSFGIEARIVKS